MNPEGQPDPVTPGERVGGAGRPAQLWRRIGLSSVARILLLVAPWAFIAYLFRDLDAVGNAFEDVSIVPIVGGLLLTIPGLFGVALLWTRLVGHLSRDVATPDTGNLLRAFARSWLARYMPGKVWSYGARVVHTDTTVTPRRILATSLVDELALMIGSAVALGLGLWAWSAAGPVVGVPLLMAAIAFVVVAISRLDQLVAWSLKHLARVMPERWRSAAEEMQKVADDPGLGLRASALFTGGYALTNLVLGAAFVLIVLSVGDIDAGDLPLLVGGYNLAGVIGIVAFFAPAGLGVREGVLAGFLTPVVGGPVAASLAILVRVVVVLADAVFLSLIEVGSAVFGRQRTPWRAGRRRSAIDTASTKARH
ncbi:MAG: hypothetical protein Q8Q00_05900 [Dehalococcoidia bacterium]|nr:hypothetical protein [Dehalococcoidia bacterium]